MEQNNYQGALQHPVNSGFNAKSTAEEVIGGMDLTGKNVIITGGYAGIGLETTRVLAEAGANIIVPARDQEKAARNLKGLPRIEPETMDLLDPESIDRFAARFLASGRPLHLLIHNAGIMWVPLRRDRRGFESQLATNYLGAFQLTARLWPSLKDAGHARVINVSSYGHQMAPFDFEDPGFEHRPYETLLGYGQSKTALNLFALELDKKGRAFGVRAYSVHPGSVYGTDLGREEPIELFKQMGTHDEHGRIKPEVAATLKTIPQGAATSVWCATSPLLENVGGVYCEDADIAILDRGDIPHRYDDPASLRGVQLYSVDRDNAERLWQLSEQMTGLSFQPE